MNIGMLKLVIMTIITAMVRMDWNSIGILWLTIIRMASVSLV